MLLAELITLMSDPKQSLGEALYKTKVLFHQLGRKDLVPWVTHKITGYPDECEVPPYRLIGAQVRWNRAVDKHGKTVDSLLRTDRSESAARAFFASHSQAPVLIRSGRPASAVMLS